MPKTTKAGVTVMVQMGVVMGASMIPEKKVPVSVVHPECNEVGEVEAVVKPTGKSNLYFKIFPQKIKTVIPEIKNQNLLQPKY